MIVSVISGAVWDLTESAAYAFLPMAIAALPMTLLPPFIDFSKRRA
jgi:hypothetical protein